MTKPHNEQSSIRILRDTLITAEDLLKDYITDLENRGGSMYYGRKVLEDIQKVLANIKP